MVKFKMGTEICFGSNAIERLDELKGQNIAIITDKFMATTEAMKQIKARLGGCKKVSVFDEVMPDPTIELITKGLNFLVSEKAESVIALGGGSSIDAAKAVVLMANQKDTSQRIKLIAIPTTSGTGSEVTQFAVISDVQQGVKYPMVDESLRPDVAILETEFVKTVPPRITADTGFDVMTHALEAYVSIGANDLSDAIAEKALELVYKHLPVAYADGQNTMAREKMHSASCIAGIAFSSASLGINHSIAHGLGAKFHIPHGRANAMLLPYVISFNAGLDESFGKGYTEAALRYAEISRRFGLGTGNIRKDVIALVEEIQYMLRMTETPATLKEVGVDKESYMKYKESIIESALSDVCTVTNPRSVSHKDIASILDKLSGYRVDL